MKAYRIGSDVIQGQNTEARAKAMVCIKVYSSSYFGSVLRGLFPKLDDFPSLFGVCDCGVLGLCGPLPLDRGLSSPFSSPTRGLYEARGHLKLLGSFDGVAVELVILGLLTCLNSPRLLVITSSKISPSSAREAPAPSSASCLVDIKYAMNV
ncbi:hypothetical protein CFP56_006891 [Quercus suber]|uniref:Uncharacterized protein n=1 Tax=Quercus suber TaxID=58331 RepID=A0AAW0M694_QUESU